MSGGDQLTLTVGGKVYGGWTNIRATRAIDRCASDFDISVSERWSGQATPWQIAPFDACTIRIGNDLVMTGYVDSYLPHFDRAAHGVRVSGRSKTQDLIDCMPEITGGQYNGYTLDKIAVAIAKPFGITVKVQTDVGAAFPDATIQKCETAFEFLERLCRMRSVLACDDESGALVLTRAGASSAASALVQGDNILAANGRLTAAKRFSKYLVLAQSGLSFGDDEVETAVMGVATDPSCPRYRPHQSMAESSLDLAGAQERARWQAIFNAARCTQATITVQGWRQADGTPWRINQRVPVRSSYLKLDRVMLVAGVSFMLGPQGHRTELTVGPVEAYTPDPAQVRLKKSTTTAAIWNGVKSIQ